MQSHLSYKFIQSLSFLLMTQGLGCFCACVKGTWPGVFIGADPLILDHLEDSDSDNAVWETK